MKKNMVLCLLVLGATVAGAQTTSYYFPNTFSSNPQDVWTLEYGPSVGSMTLMTNAGTAFWNSAGSRPSYGEFAQEFRLQEYYADNNAYLVFTCPQTGLYSLDFSITSWMQTVFSPGIKTYINIYTSASNTSIWNSSQVWSAAGSYNIDLGFYPELQQIALHAGDKIIIRFGMDNYFNYSEGVFQILSSGLTPEVTPCIVFGPEVVPTRYIYPQTFATNPTNEWSLYEGPDVSTMTPMTNSGTNFWTSGGIRPSYGEYGAQQFRTQDMFAGNNAYLVFTCPQAGNYSLQYRLETTLQTLFNPGLKTYYAVYKSTSTDPVWSSSLTWTYTLTYPLEIWFIPELQGMPMNAGDKIILMMGMDDVNNYNEGVFYLETATQGGLPFIEYTKAEAPKTPGDANGDGKVDVSDLGILAANYGTTSGATWATGDFNGDGKVDVSDLGILAANYGTGTGGSLDFNKDAKALGLVVSSDGTAAQKSDDPATSTLGCGSAGLPLVAGILLAGLLLAGLKMKD